MATDSLWIRLNIDWDRAKWIRHLPRSTRSLWPDLLRWVKMNSPVKGFIKYTGCVDDLAYDLRLDPEDAPLLAQLLAAAVAGEAVTIDGEILQVCQWDEYQDPETIRKRRAREEIESKNRKQRELESIPDCPRLVDGPQNPDRADMSGQSAKTETETETETDYSLSLTEREREVFQLLPMFKPIAAVTNCKTLPDDDHARLLASTLDRYGTLYPSILELGWAHWIPWVVNRAASKPHFAGSASMTAAALIERFIPDIRIEISRLAEPAPEKPPFSPQRHEGPMQQMDRLIASGVFENAS